jgi:hypothetical protein
VRDERRGLDDVLLRPAVGRRLRVAYAIVLVLQGLYFCAQLYAGDAFGGPVERSCSLRCCPAGIDALRRVGSFRDLEALPFAAM